MLGREMTSVSVYTALDIKLTDVTVRRKAVVLMEADALRQE